MAQYVTYQPNTYIEYTDGMDTFRQGSRDNSFVTDRRITIVGFDGTIDLDWENIETVLGQGTLGVFRDGVRTSKFILDEALTGTGFAGSENTDWVNLISLP
jgi:hypothetical protein